MQVKPMPVKSGNLMFIALGTTAPFEVTFMPMAIPPKMSCNTVVNMP